MDPQILSKSDEHFKPRSVRQNLPHRIRNFYCRNRILSKSDEHLELDSVKGIRSDRIRNFFIVTKLWAKSKKTLQTKIYKAKPTLQNYISNCFTEFLTFFVATEFLAKVTYIKTTIS